MNSIQQIQQRRIQRQKQRQRKQLFDALYWSFPYVLMGATFLIWLFALLFVATN